MSSTDRQNNLLVSEDWQKIYQSFKNADFQSYDFDNLRRTMIDYIRTNFPEDFNDYIESSEYLALIDLIAYVGQSIAFRVDLNARENFLELASRRDSVLRLARMIGYNASRNVAATGLLKFTTISTTENVIDNNGRNLAGQVITWNDGANANWYDQFIRIINAALPSTNQYGNPIDSASIYGVPTAQYRFNATNNDVPVYTFSKPVNGTSMNFEVTSTTFKGQPFIYEEPPKIANNISCVYQDDGYGAGSSATGFFFNFTQGALNTATFTITQPSSNQQVDIPVQNINSTDVWLYQLDQNGLETTLWTQVPTLTGNNIIYNSLNSKLHTVYQVITRTNDQISIAFGDGTFGQLPLGTFRVYYRSSNGLSYNINPTDLRNISVSIPYTSITGQSQTLNVYLGLSSTVSNSSPSETNASIQQNAPQTYYTQNRMITGEDYNISPLSANLQVAKVKSVNRTSSGISRYFDLVDPTGKYSSTNLFADDGVIFLDNYIASTNFTYLTQVDIENIILNDIYSILNSANLRNFYYRNYTIETGVSSIVWNSVTNNSTESSGYILSAGVIASVGTYSTSNKSSNLSYITEGALLKFVAPSGYYFNTKQNNVLTPLPNSGVIPLNGVSYIWSEVVNVAGDGRGILSTATAGTSGTYTGVLATGYGTISLNRSITSLTLKNGTVISPIVSQIIPNFVKTISSTVQTTMIDLIFTNQQFGLRYDGPSQSWQIIFQTNLNPSTTSQFNLSYAGDVSNSGLDSSWLLLFSTTNQTYTVTTRYTRYVFESDKEITFYFDSNEKTYDIISSQTITDKIKILSINPLPGGSTQSFTTDLTWKVVSEYIGIDGYIDPTKIVISFYDSDNNGIVDNPQLFLDVVYGPTPTYILQQKYLISQGQEDYQYVSNENNVVIILQSQNLVGPMDQYSDGQYFYFIETDTVVKLNLMLGTLVPTFDYQVYIGRSDLKFQYIHSADYDSRIDPGTSNIMDIYVLTVNYDTQFRQWVNGANVSKPLPPSSSELNSLLSPSLDLIKAISDEIIYHPVSYTLLFGAAAEPSLQATFNVVTNPTVAISNSEIQSGVLTAINQFFALENWNFGDTFYFSELATYVIKQMAPNVSNFVIVPSQADQYFGSLFEIQSAGNQLFISCAKASDIHVVSGLTSANLKTVTGSALYNPAILTQTITSAPNGVIN
jgi:hypothetical protein